MEQSEYIDIFEKHKTLIYDCIKDASSLHDAAGQRYGAFCYGVHLLGVYEYVHKFGYIDAQTEDDVLALFISGAYHDVIEDTDIDESGLLSRLPDVLSDTLKSRIVDIVSALTTPPGKNRKARHCEAYYEKIRKCPLASFIKMCDRISNVRVCYVNNDDKRLKMYRKEMDAFKINPFEVPVEMYDELEIYLLNE